MAANRMFVNITFLHFFKNGFVHFPSYLDFESCQPLASNTMKTTLYTIKRKVGLNYTTSTNNGSAFIRVPNSTKCTKHCNSLNENY